MKKVVFLIAIASFVSACATSPKFETWEEYNSEVTKFKDAQDISYYMSTRLHYSSPKEKREAALDGWKWKYPKETFSDGHGVCV